MDASFSDVAGGVIRLGVFAPVLEEGEMSMESDSVLVRFSDEGTSHVPRLLPLACPSLVDAREAEFDAAEG